MDIELSERASSKPTLLPSSIDSLSRRPLAILRLLLFRQINVELGSKVFFHMSLECHNIQLRNKY